MLRPEKTRAISCSQWRPPSGLARHRGEQPTCTLMPEAGHVQSHSILTGNVKFSKGGGGRATAHKNNPVTH